MATTLDSIIQKPVAKAHHRGLMALVAGVVVAGALATTAVIVDGDSDAAKPAPQEQTAPQASPVEDPLITRYGQPTVGYKDDAALDRELRFAQRR